MKFFSRAEAEQIMSQRKEIVGSAVWTSRPNYAGSRVWAAPLADMQGITIPGLTLYMEVRSPIYADACLYLFTLLQRGTPNAPRLYQLEVCPPQKPSHRDAGQQFFGPHEHVGDEALPLQHEALKCGDWKSGFDWLLGRVNVMENLFHYVPAP